MKHPDPVRLKILTVLGLLCISVPIALLGLWIRAFDLGNTQSERVDTFTGYFPDFLHGRYTITLVSIAFCILAIIVSKAGRALDGKSWKILNTLVMILGVVFLLWNLWSLL